MSFPIRCFTCGKIIGDKWELYSSHLEDGKLASDAFAIMDIKRYCCKRMFLGHVEIVDKQLLYSRINDKDSDEKSAK